MKERFGNGKIVEELASFLEYKHNRNRYLQAGGDWIIIFPFKKGDVSVTLMCGR